MAAFIMVVFILELKTEWISYSSSDWKIVERQQGVKALLLYQVQTVTPLRKKSIETVNSLTLSFVSTMAAIPLVAKRRLAQLVEHLSYTQ